MKNPVGLKFILESFCWEVNIKLDWMRWRGGVMKWLSSYAWSNCSWALVYIEVTWATVHSLYSGSASRPIGWADLIRDSGRLLIGIALLASGHTRLSGACCEVLQSLLYYSCDNILELKLPSHLVSVSWKLVFDHILVCSLQFVLIKIEITSLSCS